MPLGILVEFALPNCLSSGQVSAGFTHEVLRLPTPTPAAIEVAEGVLTAVTPGHPLQGRAGASNAVKEVLHLHSFMQLLMLAGAARTGTSGSLLDAAVATHRCLYSEAARMASGVGTRAGLHLSCFFMPGGLQGRGPQVWKPGVGMKPVPPREVEKARLAMWLDVELSPSGLDAPGRPWRGSSFRAMVGAPAWLSHSSCRPCTFSVSLPWVDGNGQEIVAMLACRCLQCAKPPAKKWRFRRRAQNLPSELVHMAKFGGKQPRMHVSRQLQAAALWSIYFHGQWLDRRSLSWQAWGWEGGGGCVSTGQQSALPSWHEGCLVHSVQHCNEGGQYKRRRQRDYTTLHSCGSRSTQES